MIFLHFANASDVERPVSVEAWHGAFALDKRCLGLKDSALMRRVGHVVVDVGGLGHDG